MSYLKFDKSTLINLDKSLTKETLRTNRAGAYNSTTLVDCNTRKYHGQLVIPVPELDDDNHVLLSSLDETVIQHGAEFNLGLHKYDGNNFNPNGHKYIREFDFEVIARTIYRVGGVVLSKERLLVSFEPRALIRYTLLEAHSPTLLRFKPFLAFRNVNSLTTENFAANSTYEEADNGISMCMYPGYPRLYMQFSKSNEYHHQPVWNKNIEYPKEQERGYAYKEDLLVPGYFEMPIKKGESIIFSAGIDPVSPRSMKTMWEKQVAIRIDRVNMYTCLVNAAEQFYIRKDRNRMFLLAGYPWFKARVRDQFVSLPGCTFIIGKMEEFHQIMNTNLPEIYAYINKEDYKYEVQDYDDPDLPLWINRTIQMFALKTSVKEAAERYGDLILTHINYIRKQKHANLFLHNNGLLYVNGKEKPATWMNATENGLPITPRTGYVVEINALWYNALKFAAQIAKEKSDVKLVESLEKQAEKAKASFVETFWNGTYLYDYVDGNYSDQEVRPNMIFAVGLPFSPLNLQQQKAVVDITTKELLTPKGLRTLSPKSGSYRPLYIGGQLERNRNYHNGPVWPWTFGTYADAYLKIYKRSGRSFIERMLIGFEYEMTHLTIGTISELFDGNPPFKGHGGMSFAMNVAEILRVLDILKQTENAE